MSAAQPHQGDVYWASLDPTVGREIAKRRPVLIVSPDSMNRNLQTVIAAPITTTIRPWPTTVDPRPALHILQSMFAP